MALTGGLLSSRRVGNVRLLPPNSRNEKKLKKEARDIALPFDMLPLWKLRSCSTHQGGITINESDTVTKLIEHGGRIVMENNKDGNHWRNQILQVSDCLNPIDAAILLRLLIRIDGVSSTELPLVLLRRTVSKKDKPLPEVVISCLNVIHQLKGSSDFDFVRKKLTQQGLRFCENWPISERILFLHAIAFEKSNVFNTDYFKLKGLIMAEFNDRSLAPAEITKVINSLSKLGLLTDSDFKSICNFHFSSLERTQDFMNELTFPELNFLLSSIGKLGRNLFRENQSDLLIVMEVIGDELARTDQSDWKSADITLALKSFASTGIVHEVFLEFVEKLNFSEFSDPVQISSVLHSLAILKQTDLNIFKKIAQLVPCFCDKFEIPQITLIVHAMTVSNHIGVVDMLHLIEKKLKVRDWKSPSDVLNLGYALVMGGFLKGELVELFLSEISGMSFSRNSQRIKAAVLADAGREKYAVTASGIFTQIVASVENPKISQILKLVELGVEFPETHAPLISLLIGSDFSKTEPTHLSNLLVNIGKYNDSRVLEVIELINKVRMKGRKCDHLEDLFSDI